MTLVSLPGPIFWPGLTGSITNTPSIGNLTALTSAGSHYQAYVVCAREDMTISHVAFRVGSATGSNDFDVRIETVATTGLPSGTLWATNTNGTVSGATANANYQAALTASASITKGQLFCVKLLLSSGTSATPQGVANVALTTLSNIPYSVLNTGTPTKGNLGTGLIGLGSSSTAYYYVPGLIPPASYTASTFNNTNGAKRGLRFTPPMNCRAVGLRWFNSTAVGDFNAVLYSDAGSELSSSSTAFDGDATFGGQTVSNVYFDNTVSLTAGTTYRLVVEPSSATNVNVSTFTIAQTTASGLTGTPVTGLSNTHYTTFASSAWDDTNTTLLPLMDLIIDQVDNGSGTGGVVGVIGG
jgi:hypothetical protein